MRRSALVFVLAIVITAAGISAAWMHSERRQALSEASSAESARLAAERDAKAAQEHLFEARSANEAAGRAVREAREQLARERTAREAAEQAVNEARK
jgi:hypothetical protein